eukprot:360614-Chlamydomonas_euryale.AAC.2
MSGGTKSARGQRRQAFEGSGARGARGQRRQAAEGSGARSAQGTSGVRRPRAAAPEAPGGSGDRRPRTTVPKCGWPSRGQPRQAAMSGGTRSARSRRPQVAEGDSAGRLTLTVPGG